jgi:hypothetical protein
MVIDRDIMKLLAENLSLYSEYKKHIIELEEEILNNGKGGYEEHITSKHKISRKVEDDVIKLMSNSELNYYKDWVKSIDWLIEQIISDPIKMKLLKYKYLDKIEKVKDKDVITKLSLQGLMSDGDKKYFMKVKEQILYKLEQQARRLNLLK